MAKAMAKCKCEKCGNTFTKVSYQNSRTEADKWESWASNTYNLCPDCYKAEKEEKEKKLYNKIASKYNLPEISGASEEQIAYADNLRRKYVITHVDKIEFFEPVDWDVIKAAAEAEGKSEEQYTKENVDNIYLKAYICLRISNASKIIDILK